MTDKWSRRHVLGTVGTAGVISIAGCADADEGGADEPNESGDAESDGGSEIHADYETTEVRAVTEEGDELGTVTAAIADTSELLVRGLSETEELPADRGMLFVYEEEDQRQFVMRDMDFGIDIVYADADGTITGLHHAPAPREHEDGSRQVYVGQGKYVLEVAYDWTTDHDVRPGDILEFDLEDENEDADGNEDEDENED